MTQTPRTINVSLPDRSYPILIGEDLLDNAGLHLKDHLKRSRTVVVTDETVAKFQLPRLLAGLEASEITGEVVTLPPGEETKSFANLERLCNTLLASKVERNDTIIALGGGVVGDLTGFAASILRRGIDFVQIPTTLLAQVDSSVGGKTGINTQYGKNLVGAFHQPRAVLADISALETLPQRDLKSGYAEIVKYGLISNLAFFEWLEANGETLLSGDRAARTEAVEKSCRAKAKIVADDERETGTRALLNLGHTFAHALEAETGYSDRLYHGEAVSIGIAMAHDFSARTGVCPGQDAERVRKHLKAAGLKTDISDIEGDPITADKIVQHMFQDKKVVDGKLTLILTHGIGRAYIAKDTDPTTLTNFLIERT